MSDLKNVFDDSISNIIDNDKKKREETKAKLEEIGIKEILEYIIERINLPEDEKNNNDKIITERLIDIEKNSFYKKYNEYFEGKFEKASLGMIEKKEMFWFSLCLSFEDWYNNDYHWHSSTKSVLHITKSLFGERNIVVLINGKENLIIPIEKEKTFIAKEIIKFILG